MTEGALAALAYDAFANPPDAAVRFLVRASPRRPRLTVLDVGCGTGRLLEPLAILGHRVIGIEPYEPYWERAREKAEGLSRALVRRQGLLDLDERAAFDLIAIIDGPLAYLVTPEERRQALALCFKALKPGGRLVIDVPNFLWIFLNYEPPQPREVTFEGWQLSRTPSHTIDVHSATLLHLDAIEAQGPAEVTFSISVQHRLGVMTWPELRDQLGTAGFTALQTFPSLRHDTAGPLDGPRMVVTAMKPR